MKKIALIGTAGIPARYGGFETLANQLVNELNEQVKFKVYCSSEVYDKYDRYDTFLNTELVYLPLSANGWQSIPYDIISILDAIRSCDVLLILGVPGAIILPFIKMFSKKKIIVHLDGLEWKRDKWNKAAKMYLKFAEQLAVKYSDAVIADNEGLNAYVQSTYKKESTTIAYGADHTFKEVVDDTFFYTKFPFLENQKFAFSVCRIEPENNIHVILEAYEKLTFDTLVIVGNWEHSAYGKTLFKKYESFKNVHLINPIYKNKLLDKFKEKASVYLHGHSAGGTNPSLVEAMYAQLPIFAYDCNFNRFTTKDKAYYFSTSEDIQKQILSLEASDLESNANSMYTIAQNNYIWNKISDKYLKLFDGVKSGSKLAELAK